MKALLRKFHALCHVNGLADYEKAAIVESFGHSSSSEMTDGELINAIDRITNIQLAKEHREYKLMDGWRKRVIAVIGAYLRRQNREEGIELIKAIACRAAAVTEFNAINEAALKRIYNEFLRRNETGSRVMKLQEEFELEAKQCN